MHFRQALIAAAIAAALAAPTWAKWVPVAANGAGSIEFDKSRIARQADGGVTAWSRLLRDGIYIDEQGMRYTAVEALNRYDCAQSRFATLKRVWLRDGQRVREETVVSPQALVAEAGSVDARLLAEACQGYVAEPAPVADGRPGVMYADMRSAAEAGKPRTLAVADPAHGDKKNEAKPADKNAGKAADKAAAEKAAEQPPAGGKPRFIELPKIDKSQVEDPNKPPAAKPAEPGKEAKGAEAAKSAKGAKSAKADVREVAKSAGTAAEHGTAGSSRQEIERQYAMSGPRKTAKKTAKPEAVVEHKQIHWSYEGEGAPANWGKLEPGFATCATGRRQSPIDIRDGIIKVDLEPIKFDYKWTQFRIVNNGHSIQVEVGEGSSITVMGRSYQLAQFHFHRPSEEKVRGKAFDMVAHLVHRDDEGRLAVIAVLMEKGASEHPFIQTLWNNMPLEVNQVLTPETAVDLNRVLPEERAYYTYMGSLTTPPCTEDVLWMVFKQPIVVTEQQISIFSRLYKNNARPVQPANDRLIKESR